MAWSRYIGIGIESVYGTPVALTKYTPLLSESMSQNNGVLQADTAESSWITKQVLGPYTVGGTFDILPEPENCGLLIKTILPTVANSSQTGTTVEHTFTPHVDTYPIYTLALGTDLTAGEKKITSAMTTKMSIKAAAPDLLGMSFSYIGKTDLIGALSSPSFSALEPFAYHETSVEIATVANADVEAIQIDIEKDRYSGSHTLGSRYHPRNSGTGRTKVSGTVDLSFETLTAYKQFYDGATGVTPPARTYTQNAIELLTTGIISDTPDTYLLNVIVPKIMFDTNKADVSKADRTIQNLSFMAVGAPPVSVVLQNQVATY